MKTRKAWSEKEDAFIISLLKKNGNKTMSPENYRQLSNTMNNHFGVKRSISALTARFSKLKDQMLRNYGSTPVISEPLTVKQVLQHIDPWTLSDKVQLMNTIKEEVSTLASLELEELGARITLLKSLTA